ncbi:MAG: hypothetical protein ACLU38_05490 [Dysosmobacter sp.]
MLGFLSHYQGSISLCGRDVRHLSRRELARLAAYIPQSSAAVVRLHRPGLRCSWAPPRPGLSRAGTAAAGDGGPRDGAAGHSAPLADRGITPHFRRRAAAGPDCTGHWPSRRGSLLMDEPAASSGLRQPV